MIGEKKKCIGLIFGGYSNEHEVSISSARTVFQAFNAQINKERFTVKAFYINKHGDWLDSDLSEKILIGEITNNTTKKQDCRKLMIWSRKLLGVEIKDISIISKAF